jgi:hypothetical protein
MEGINYINKAISNKNDIIKFEIQPNLDPSHVGNNTIKNRNQNLDYQYIDVPCVSIDEYFKDNIFNRGALWVDAEGANEEVLTGSREKLKDFASIYIEVEGEEYWKGCWQKDQVIEYLSKHGFKLFFEKPCYGNQFDAIFISSTYLEVVREALSK